MSRNDGFGAPVVNRQSSHPKDPRAWGARCDECPLKGATPVWGDGPPDALHAAIGEAPGRDEVSMGIPFVGKSGQTFENWLTKLGLTRREVWIDNSVMCLVGSTSVKMADGTTKRISDIVSERDGSSVLTLLQDGTVGARPVVGWFRNPRAGRKLFKVTSKYAKQTSRGPVGPIVTDNHQIWTRDGWVRADQLNGLEMATGHLVPGLRGASALEGAMMGDGTIPREARCFQTSHTEANLDYVEHLVRLWSPLGVSTGRIQPQKAIYNGSVIVAGPQRTARIASSPYFGVQRERWYPRGKKIIPRDLSLTSLMLAVWFMDDGSTSIREAEGERHKPRSSMATCGFTRDDVEWLASKLNTMGLTCYPNFNRWARINFSTIGTERLHSIVAPFICDSMQYKLTSYHQGKFDRSLFEPEPAGSFFDTAVTTEVEMKDQTVFCIEVDETHNFFTTNAVVENCMPPGGDMKLFLVREKKNYKKLKQEDKWRDPVDCCRPRLLRALKVPVCKRCGKWMRGPDDYLCLCKAPQWLKIYSLMAKAGEHMPRSVLYMGNFAMRAILGFDGISKRAGYVENMKERRERLLLKASGLGKVGGQT